MQTQQNTDTQAHRLFDRRIQTRADALDALSATLPTEGIALEWLLDQTRESKGSVS